jgi:C4-dicarboxylate transporter DctQ subunit
MSAGYALGGLFCVLGAYTGFFMAMHQYTIGQVTPSLMLPEWIYGSFVPIGMGIMCIRFFICAYETIKEKEPTEAKGGSIIAACFLFPSL